jgi:hypothetical protein
MDEQTELSAQKAAAGDTGEQNRPTGKRPARAPRASISADSGAAVAPGPGAADQSSKRTALRPLPEAQANGVQSPAYPPGTKRGGAIPPGDRRTKLPKTPPRAREGSSEPGVAAPGGAGSLEARPYQGSETTASAEKPGGSQPSSKKRAAAVPPPPPRPARPQG